MTAPSFDRIDLDSLSPQSRWVLENLAVPHRLEDVELDALASQHELGLRVVRRMLDALDGEVRAQQVGAELPAHTRQELAALDEHLRRHGQIYPVIRIKVGGRVVAKDGASREALLKELNVQVEYRDVDVGDAEEARTLAIALNLARRQLDPRKVRSIAAAEVLHDPSRSDRAIAELLGVHHGTVARARRELEKLGLVDHVSTRVGRDGVQQPVLPGPVAPRREEKLTAILSQLRDLAKSEDRAIAHMRADALIVETLKLLGVEAIAETFEKVCKRS